ncbi:SRPR [Cordylochernes scorpioides]|uniref:SRPR n=1 Tax=Cordylochernes scorpioides TaxID=51811 RepID=A0ABY6KAL0_9ARAC|nr:SRPR [Cordylochernes scorpioides]
MNICVCFQVAYQNFVQQAYVDKFLDDISLEFRDKYKQELEGCNFFYNYEFSENFQKVSVARGGGVRERVGEQAQSDVQVLHVAEEYGKELENKPRVMRTFQESQKSKKTVASLTETKVETKVTAAAPITNKKKKGNKAKNEGWFWFLLSLACA